MTITKIRSEPAIEPQHIIYTIGYGKEAKQPGLVREKIKEFLKSGGFLIDIRLTPYSTILGWNTEDLLHDYGDFCLHIIELGNLHHHTGQEILLVDETNGLSQAQYWLEKAHICLLCGCYNPSTCHRGYVASKLAYQTHAPVCHLLHNELKTTSRPSQSLLQPKKKKKQELKQSPSAPRFQQLYLFPEPENKHETLT